VSIDTLIAYHRARAEHDARSAYLLARLLELKALLP
jgi:hypothetical protein